MTEMILRTRTIWTLELWTSAQTYLTELTNTPAFIAKQSAGWWLAEPAVIVHVSVLTLKRLPRCVSPVAISNVRIDSSQVRPTFKRILSRAGSLSDSVSVCRLSHSWLLLQKTSFPRVPPHAFPFSFARNIWWTKSNLLAGQCRPTGLTLRSPAVN